MGGGGCSRCGGGGCPSSHSQPGRMRLKCADESAVFAGKDETFITAASGVRSRSVEGRRGVEGRVVGGVNWEFRC